MHRFLLDENLSPWAAVELRKVGVDVVHLRNRGVLGVDDAAVFALPYREDRVLVTANVGDFRKLASSVEAHVGLVLVEDAALSRKEQLEVLRRVLASLQGEDDLVNRALIVRLDGSLSIEEIPTP